MAERFSEDPPDWVALAEVATDLGYADWRNEILSFLFYATEVRPLRSVVTPLRPAI